MDAFLHAVLALRELPAQRRDIWKTMMDYYVLPRTAIPWRTCPPTTPARWGR